MAQGLDTSAQPLNIVITQHLAYFSKTLSQTLLLRLSQTLLFFMKIFPKRFSQLMLPNNLK